MKRLSHATWCLMVMLIFGTTSLCAQTLSEDTTKVIDLEEVTIISSPKETSKLRQLPTSVSLISQKEMQAHHITSLKGASTIFQRPLYESKRSPTTVFNLSQWQGLKPA